MVRLKERTRSKLMKEYFCAICAWVYDPVVGHPEGGIEPGTPWEEVPEDWCCPLCKVGKDQFFSVK